MTKEAHALHLVDMLDAKMAICDNLLDAGIDDKGFTGWSKELESCLWQGIV
jgi:hypothetical protein